VYVRAPLKSPSDMPPDQTILCPGSNSMTLTGNARPGLTLTKTLMVSPGAIRPSTRSTPESHRE